MSAFRIALVGRINGADETRNVFTFEHPTGLLPTAAEVATWLDSLFTISVLAEICDVWASERWIMETPDGTGHWSYVADTNYIKVGTAGTDSLPQQVAVVIIGITPSRRRGKKFMAAIPESDQDNGVLGAAPLGVWQGFADAYVADMTMATGVAHSGVCHPDGSNFLQFTAGRVDRILGTQRKRKQGRGA